MVVSAQAEQKVEQKIEQEISRTVSSSTLSIVAASPSACIEFAGMARRTCLGKRLPQLSQHSGQVVAWHQSACSQETKRRCKC